MPAAITLKNVPDDIYERLKSSAKAHRRSINMEAIACLERSLGQPQVDAEQRLAEIRKLRESLKFRAKPAEIRRAIKQGRP